MSKLKYSKKDLEITQNSYFDIPLPPANTEFPEDPKSAPDLAFVMAVNEAKQGNFDHINSFFEIYNSEQENWLKYYWTIFIGDAGPDSVVEEIGKRLEKDLTEDDFELANDFCRILSRRGKLGDIPLMLKLDKLFGDIADSDIFHNHISDMLGERGSLLDPSGYASYEDYSRTVVKKYDEVVKKVGSPDTLVLYGEMYGIIPIAKKILTSLESQPDIIFNGLWHRFQTSTGIDCRKLFKKDAKKTEALEAIQNFLNSPESGKYKTGMRYFFGHEIP